MNQGIEIVDLAMRIVGAKSLEMSRPLQRYYEIYVLDYIIHQWKIWLTLILLKLQTNFNVILIFFKRNEMEFNVFHCNAYKSIKSAMYINNLIQSSIDFKLSMPATTFFAGFLSTIMKIV